MCGIAGYFGDLEPNHAETLLRLMSKTVAHRGPDGAGLWQGPFVGLAHRRLATIDLTYGSQPMTDVTGRFCITFNGEIYNHGALRKELQDAGYHFATTSDTEIIAAAIEYYGASQAFARFRGMYAFALYDKHECSILLARDKVGIKPLYFSYKSDLLLFASEPKAILETGKIGRQANVQALSDFLRVGVPIAPYTAWRDIHELEPGTWRKFYRDKNFTGRFWQWDGGMAQNMSLADAEDLVEAQLQKVLRSQTQADVSLGAFLSGGVDSSLLVAMLAKQQQMPIKTFSMQFIEPKYDESAYAKKVSEKFQTEHHTIRLGIENVSPQKFSQIAEHFDQPFGDSSCIPTFILCEEAAKQVKIIIAGDGGDEMFGGYRRYQYAYLLSQINKLPGVTSFLLHLSRVGGNNFLKQKRQLKKFSDLCRVPPNEQILGLHRYFTEQELQKLLVPDFYKSFKNYNLEGRIFESMQKNLSLCDNLVAADVNMFLHADYLRKVDFASSACGLEVRLPYLDDTILELAQKLPIHFKVRGTKLKILLKKIARLYLPLEIVDRPKMGFSIPFAFYTQSAEMRAYLYDLILGKNSNCQYFFIEEEVKKLWMFFQNDSPSTMSQYLIAQKIFFIASFELWLKKWQPSVSFI